MVRNVFLCVALVLCAAPARASGLPEFEGPLSELLILAAARPPRKAVPPPPAPERAADAATWARLMDRAHSRSTLVQEVRAGNTDYKVFVVVVNKGVEGQPCPRDMTPRVSLFVARVVRGPGGEVYPARLTVQCVGAALTRQEASVDADEDGLIRDFGAYDPASEKILQFGKAKLTPAQKARFDALIAGAVALLLGE